MNIKNYGYLRIKSSLSDIQIQKIKQHLKHLQDERDLFIDIDDVSHYSTEQYTLLKRILRKKDNLYISSLSDLGENKKYILQEWIDLTQNLEVSIFILDLLRLQKNETQPVFYEITIHILNWLAAEEQEIDPPLPSPNQTNINFPVAFIDAYNYWKKGEITPLIAMRRCNLSRTRFYQLVKKYENL
ncbi:DNA recombinase [Bacillus cereus]|uniref:DNA recombinase n=1 Tax=Bacillus cereus TaxID=1396 RepID=A0A9X7CPR4_BACCE|nr:DNA recombinase [Bacillus cereus]PGS80309.1 DNA recombinase [Bacillus cereus]